ncbi:MAG: HRDC domain-containing protein [Deltaproteobacteria bacterium]|nr:HRDC domain-containing protein [Deltaproteobacteria bacterium]
MITNTQALTKLCLELAQEPVLAFDTEFVREHTYLPELALIQVATDKQAYLIDPTCFDIKDMAPLLDLLQNQKVLKVLHAAYGDQECLQKIYGITASPILDTLEAASLMGLGESISLEDLLRKTIKVKLSKNLSRTRWLNRPLSPEMESYALDDVKHLVRLSQYLESELKKLDRWDWALELSAAFSNPKLYEEPLESMAQKLAKSRHLKSHHYACLKRLLKWREERALSLNQPRKRLADDATLISLARSQPKTLKQLANFRGLHLREVKKQGQELLNLLQSQEEDKKTALPLLSKGKHLGAQEKSVVSFLATLIKCLCQELRLANRLVMTNKELEILLAEELYTQAEWIQRGLIHPQAASLVGETLEEALAGKKLLGIQNKKLKIY